MRSRVSMRFARLRHGGHDDDPPQIKISNPTLKHSSVAFSTGASTSIGVPASSSALEAAQAQKARGQATANSLGSPEVGMASPGRGLLVLDADPGFADMIKIVDDNLSDGPPELSESPAMARESGRESEPREMYVSDDKEWSKLELEVKLGGLQMHRDDIFAAQALPQAPDRTSSRHFSISEPEEPALNPRTTSKIYGELARVRQELEVAQLTLESERREKESLRRQLSEATAPVVTQAPPASAIEEYKQAITRLNEIRALQIQDRDARIALLEEALLRKEYVPSKTRDGAFQGRIPGMRVLLPVAAPPAPAQLAELEEASGPAPIPDPSTLFV